MDRKYKVYERKMKNAVMTWTSEHTLARTVKVYQLPIKILFTDIFLHVVKYKIRIKKILIDNSPKLQIKYVLNVK